jgi:hypothetical protein
MGLGAHPRFVSDSCDCAATMDASHRRRQPLGPSALPRLVGRRSDRLARLLSALLFGAVACWLAIGGTSAVAVEAAATAGATSFLSDNTQRGMTNEMRRFSELHKSGIENLKQVGFDLVIVIPSLDEMAAMARELRKVGRVSEDTVRSIDALLATAPPQERKQRKYVRVGHGFEPKTALPRPFGVKTSSGETVNVSDAFMARFQITTEYDLHRLIRNASIVFTNFAMKPEQDDFRVHRERLAKALDSATIVGGDPDSDARLRAIGNFTQTLMVLDSIIPGGGSLSADEILIAAIVIGTRYRLF